VAGNEREGRGGGGEVVRQWHRLSSGWHADGGLGLRGWRNSHEGRRPGLHGGGRPVEAAHVRRKMLERTRTAEEEGVGR
jgi:hypothetical protein